MGSKNSTIRYGPKKGSTEKLIQVDPSKMFKDPEPVTSRDALSDELEKHMNNAEKRYNNLLISPQRKIIEDILLETPEGESADAALIARKIDERFSKVTEYYIKSAKEFEPLSAAYDLHQTLRRPDEKYGRDEKGRITIIDYDEVNGGVDPNNPESVHYMNLINGKEDLDGKPIRDQYPETIIIKYNEPDEDSLLDPSLFNF